MGRPGWDPIRVSVQPAARRLKPRSPVASGPHPLPCTRFEPASTIHDTALVAAANNNAAAPLRRRRFHSRVSARRRPRLCTTSSESEYAQAATELVQVHPSALPALAAADSDLRFAWPGPGPKSDAPSQSLSGWPAWSRSESCRSQHRHRGPEPGVSRGVCRPRLPGRPPGAMAAMAGSPALLALQAPQKTGARAGSGS
jgi:hypothetical protein